MPGAHLTRSRRFALLAVGALLLGAVLAAVPAARDDLMWWGPLLLLVGLMLAGVRPDEVVERLERLARRAPQDARHRRSDPARTRVAARRPSVRVVRSGLLIASSLATRPPPARRAAAQLQ